MPRRIPSGQFVYLMMNRKLLKIIIVPVLAIALIFGLAMLREHLQERDDELALHSDRKYAEPVPQDDERLAAYLKAHPEKEEVLIMACAGDLTNDGTEDLVVVYHSGSHGECESVACVFSADGTFWETPATPAPQQHQKLRFFNMDKEGELELLVTGDKNGDVGYAIYRIIDGELINLFGEGMEDCC